MASLSLASAPVLAALATLAAAFESSALLAANRDDIPPDALIGGAPSELMYHELGAFGSLGPVTED